MPTSAQSADSQGKAAGIDKAFRETSKYLET